MRAGRGEFVDVDIDVNLNVNATLDLDVHDARYRPSPIR